jgi:glycosyltransferase involved in cell wall biosynthesis
MNIRVFTDLRFTTHPKPTGVGKHIFQMVSGLNQIQGNEVSVLATKDQAGHHRSGSLSFLEARHLPVPWKMAEALWTLTGHPLADRWLGDDARGSRLQAGKTDWIYCPKNDFIPVRSSRVAVTIHGAHELDPQFPQSQSLPARLNRARRRASYRRMLGQADLVLTVSSFLKQQMMDWFDVPEEKFCVVGNGVESEFFSAADQPPGLSGQPTDRPFILCVGGLNELDGGDRILRVAAALQQREPDLRILVAGGDHQPDMLAQASQLQNTERLGYVGAGQLALLMRDAVALFYPTRYETFGIAAAEAMATGTPVITCHSTAVPEVVGGAGLYCAEDNHQLMAEMILDLLTNGATRAHHSAAGRERAQRFTWDACVQRLSKALSIR